MTKRAVESAKTITSIAPGANLGFSRMNWVVDRPGVGGVILYSAGPSDFLGEFAESLSHFGLKLAALQDKPEWPSERLDAVEVLVGDQDVEEGGDEPVTAVWVWHSGDAKVSRARLLSRPGLPVIAIFDDAAALGLGAEGADSDALDAMIEAARAQHDMLKLLAGLERETFIVSARKAKDFAEALLQALADFLGVTVDEAAMKRAVACLSRELPAFAYTMRFDVPSDSLFRGNVDSHLKNGILSGWVKLAIEDDRVQVRVLIDGKEVTREMADYRRDDLVGHGIGDGGYGYVIDLGRFLGEDPKYVEVRTVDRDILVGASEMTIKRGNRVAALIAT